jgi:hypothetical protein
MIGSRGAAPVRAGTAMRAASTKARVGMDIEVS